MLEILPLQQLAQHLAIGRGGDPDQATRAAQGDGDPVTLIAAGAIVLDSRVCRPGWLETSGGRILACGPGAPPRRADHEFADGVVVPGFIDMHVHGGGGASYTDGVSADVARAAGFHRGHGTTTTLASLVTASPTDLLAQVGMLAEMTRRVRSPVSIGRAVVEFGALRCARCRAAA